uniref:Putative conserved secreted protein n=1 Tax=Corethrella appendiculata TaxID=1370023 RepID=U5ES57_9DIPT
MQIRWKVKRKIIVAVLVLIVLYYVISSSYTKYEIDATIPDTKPEDVWEYLSDFSKMKILNPTILDFKITSDYGNYEHWKYHVEYTERLSHWPYYLNRATALYSIKQLPKEEGGYFSVASVHKTCFFLGLFCLKSKGEFRLSVINEKDTYCVETVFYQCPLFFGQFCKREVEFQRKAIFTNLAQQFKKNNKQTLN